MVDRIPFWLHIGKDNPYERATAQFQRDQVDQQPEAGEASLAGWWTRSQMSFHYGAGLAYLDTNARPAEEDRVRFELSRNVDVWTPGKVTRLNGTAVELASTLTARTWVDSVNSGFVFADDTKLYVNNGVTTAAPVTTGRTATGFCTDGTSLYMAFTDGTVWRYNVTGNTWAQLYKWTTTSAPVQLGYVKQRLMLGVAGAVYELDSTLANDTARVLPTAKYTHPNPDWQWSAFTDSPSGILAAGYAGSNSGIFRFELTQVADAPVLGAGIALLSLPRGERVLSAIYYLGSLLVLGTNRGIRVNAFDSYYGTMSLGPLTVETDAPVTALGGYDRFIYAGTKVGAETSLIRVDLGAPLDDAGHYAWAPDLVMPGAGSWTQTVTALSFRADGRLLIGVPARGLVAEQTGTDPSEAAWLRTARMRFGTVEDKFFAYASVRGIYSDEAPIGVSTDQPSDLTPWAPIYVAGPTSERFGLQAVPDEWIALRFDFAEGAELWSYQVQALPGGRRQRLIALPLWLGDFEQTRSGREVGYTGFGRERLALVEHLEDMGAQITVTAPALFTEAVTGVIERLSFSQLHDVGDTTPGTGGVLTLVLRTTA